MTSIGKTESKMDVETKNKGTDDDVNEALYSRQLYTLGKDAQRKLAKANVFIYGLTGSGIEIAKNVTLSGVNTLVIADPTPCSHADQGSNFFIDNASVKAGTTRAEACRGDLQELNRHVDIQVASLAQGELPNASHLNQYQIRCLVVNGGMVSISDRIALDKLCRSMDIKFISFESRGLFASVFCDFGEKHIVTDKDGANPSYRDVQIITNGEEGVVTILDDNDPHNMGDGDYVTFEGLRGAEKLNNCEPRKIKVVNARSFSIGDTRDVGIYDTTGGGGYVKQVKVPVEMSFASMESVYANPDPKILHSDFAKFENPGFLHKAFHVLDSCTTLPTPQSGVSEFLTSLASRVEGGQLTASQQRLATAFAMGSTTELNPMATVIGGLVGQEITKAVSNKFTPLDQLLYIDAIECLSDNDKEWPLPVEEYQTEGSRYDHQITVFGKSFVQKLRDTTMFIVGSGAIGCEMLKNWALMGLGTSGKSRIHITDMDIIEVSNLSRQFLFRPDDVKKFKSECAAKKIKEMNPDITTSVYQEKVGPDTESFFNDDFYHGLTAVCTALDNIQARLYVDQRCVEFGKAMFESGTEGVMGNTQVIIPHVTAEYGAYRDAAKKTTPICTLKHFPHRIEHTIQWARSEFQGLFTDGPQDANSYLQDGQNFVESLEPNIRSTVCKSVKKYLDDEKPLTFEQCVIWARLKYESLFTNDIKQLLYNFPPGFITNKGVPFWSGKKRTPTPAEFSVSDEWSFTFIQAASILRAQNFNLKQTDDWFNPEFYKKTLDKVMIPEFNPTKAKIATSEEEAKKMQQEQQGNGGDDGDEDEKIDLPNPAGLAGFKLSPAEFEKDDDTNFHMAFITATSNLRARAYMIPEADVFRTKQIAGNIIPAIATTTALVTGFVCLEMYKYIRGEERIDQYKSQQVNLALPLFNPMEPAPAEKVKGRLRGADYEYTVWDTLVIPGKASELLLKDFLSYFENELKLDCSMVSYGTSLVYFSFGANNKARMEKTLKQVIEEVTKKEMPDSSQAKYIKLDCCVEEDDYDEDIEFPTVKILNA